MKRNITVVMSHADSSYKEEILLKCVSAIKKNGGDIILASHISVPNKIVEFVDYFIYEKENPLIMWHEYETLGCGIYFWMDYEKYYLSKKVDFNHGYAALKLMILSAYLSKACGYDKIHFINYDFIINDDKVLKEHCEDLETKDAIFYQWSDSVYTSFFSFNVEKFIETFENIKSKSDYCSYGIAILENFFSNMLSEKHIDYLQKNIESIGAENQIDLIYQGRIYGLYNIEGNDIRLVIGKFEESHYIFVSAEKDTKNKIQISYKEDCYELDIASIHFIEIPYEMMDFGFYINFDKLKTDIKVNLFHNISTFVIRDKDIIINIEKLKKKKIEI
jgi:hypothetical protein